MNGGWEWEKLGWEKFRESLSVTDDVEGKLQFSNVGLSKGFPG